MQHIFDQITFLIPIRIDSEERQANTNAVIRFLNQMTNSKINVLEADRTPRFIPHPQCRLNNYRFVEDADPVYHRTHYLNEMLKQVDTPIAALWDADVVVPKKQIADGALRILEQHATMSVVYDGRACYFPAGISELFRKSVEIEQLETGYRAEYVQFGIHSVGGALLINKDRYMIEAGGENEHFYGWGMEDNERVMRLEILNLPLYRSAGPAFHLYHPIKANSWFTKPELERANRIEFLKICRLSKPELQRYIHSKEWNSRPQKKSV